MRNQINKFYFFLKKKVKIVSVKTVQLVNISYTMLISNLKKKKDYGPYS